MLYQRYPDAHVIQVSQEDYPRLAEQLRSRGYSQNPTALALNDAASSKTYYQQPDTQKNHDCDNQGISSDEESFNIMLDISSDVLRNTPGNNHDNAPILFVIVGTIVVIVWVLYVFKYMFDVATGFRPCGYWNEFSLTSSRITRTINQYAEFDGLTYMTGFRDGLTDVGISIELGHADLQLPQLLSQRLQGRYWLLGPVLRWRFTTSTNPSYFSMNFLAGSTEHDVMGTIAQANLGLQFGLGASAHLGLSWGAMKIDINDHQGILQDRDEYYYLYGINFGFGF